MLRRALTVAALPLSATAVATAPASTHGYANLLASVPSCTIFHDTQAISTYCFTGNGGHWWTFDDTWSIQQKASWLRSTGLLGAMVWEMSGDTGNGTLMTTLHNGLS
jgi:chitinase